MRRQGREGGFLVCYHLEQMPSTAHESVTDKEGGDWVSQNNLSNQVTGCSVKTVFYAIASQKGLFCSSVSSGEALPLMAGCLAGSQYIPS